MDVFVARQPILDVDQSLFGYELLFRSGPENLFPDFDPDAASFQLIDNSATVFDLNSLTAGKRAFLNVTRRVLIEDLISILPKDRVVVELLESIRPDAEVIAACRSLKQAGYLLALDDYEDAPEFEELIELSDFIKVDFLATGHSGRREIAKRYGSRVHLLAEKVESLEDVQEGLDLGYEYFQGYFFCQPEMVQRQEVPGFRHNYVRFIQELCRPDLDFDQVETIVEQEVALSVKLLRLINSAAFGFGSDVNSDLFIRRERYARSSAGP